MNMIKRIYIILGLLLITGAIFAQSGKYTLNGSISSTSHNGQPVYLQSLDYDHLTEAVNMDSATVVNGKFTFAGETPATPNIWVIAIEGKTPEEDIFAFFVAEPGNINMQITDKAVTTNGTDNNIKHEKMQQNLRSYYNQLSDLESEVKGRYASGNIDEETLKAMTITAQGLMTNMSETVFDYTKNNMQTGIGEFYFINYASQFTPAQMNELYKASRPSFQKKPDINTMMQKYVWSQEGVAIGSKFKGIELETPDGKKQNINDLIGKGKIILIDFWASWCAPCRKEMPELARFYTEQKNNGFEIIGISLDETSREWKTGIKAMNLTWPQFLSEGGWNGKAAQHYGITRIPQTFILDREGNIVAKDLRGIDMENKVKELLAQ